MDKEIYNILSDKTTENVFKTVLRLKIISRRDLKRLYNKDIEKSISLLENWDLVKIEKNGFEDLDKLHPTANAFQISREIYNYQY